MPASLAFTVTFAVTWTACTPKVDPSWVEHERGETHVTHEIAPIAKVDLAHPESLDEAQASEALAGLGDRAPAGAVALRAARLAHHRGGDAEARALVARATTAADEPAIHDELAALAQELAAPPVDPTTVAVLLPLTGRYAAIGAELRVAIELAGGPTKWLVLDTRGDDAGAIAAVQVAHERGAIAILGPVGERESRAAARAAMVRGIPIGLLAPADGADPAAGVFRVVESPEHEARAIAQMAAADNFPTVAVFAPRDDVARDQAEAFVAEATRLGLAVEGNGTYDPTGGDLEPDVKQFLGLVPATNERLREHLGKYGAKGWATFSPDIPFSLLYLPDRYDRAAIVAAFLPYWNVELRTVDFPDPHVLAKKHGGRVPQVVQLVGGAGWHHPSLPLRGGPAVQGALVIESCALDGDVASAFSAAFQQRVNRPPSTTAAQAYDAATLIAKLRAGAATRDALRIALAAAKLDDGACGPATMARTGELERAATILEVQGDQFVPAP